MNANLEHVVASDGRKIAACFFLPAVTPISTALIVSAMGARQDFYAPLAEWLAGQGILAATFDYRGIGRSRTESLRCFNPDIFDWARLDCAAMLVALRGRVPEKLVFWIGHSLGGQILPFVPNRQLVSKAVMIAAGSGYWRENAPTIRRRVWWLWYILAPVAVAALGYFPGARLRKVGDLPGRVMLQWRRWCLHREYAMGAEGEFARAAFASVTTPIVSLSFSDDEMVSARSIRFLNAQYRATQIAAQHLAPAEVGLKRIGHFGFFRRELCEALWRSHLLPELVTGR